MSRGVALHTKSNTGDKFAASCCWRTLPRWSRAGQMAFAGPQLLVLSMQSRPSLQQQHCFTQPAGPNCWTVLTRQQHNSENREVPDREPHSWRQVQGLQNSLTLMCSFFLLCEACFAPEWQPPYLDGLVVCPDNCHGCCCQRSCWCIARRYHLHASHGVSTGSPGWPRDAHVAQLVCKRHMRCHAAHAGWQPPAQHTAHAEQTQGESS